MLDAACYGNSSGATSGLMLVYVREFANDIDALVFGSQVRANCAALLGPLLMREPEMTIRRDRSRIARD